MYSTRSSRRVRATPAQVYAALTDGEQIARWRTPDGMTGRVHAFDPREGGAFRFSLTYEQPGASGKSTAHTDTYTGRFLALVENERVVEAIEFEADDADLGGQMTMTTTITPAGEGVLVEMVHYGVPDAVRREDNEPGMAMALANLARLVEPPGRR